MKKERAKRGQPIKELFPEIAYALPDDICITSKQADEVKRIFSYILNNGPDNQSALNPKLKLSNMSWMRLKASGVYNVFFDKDRPVEINKGLIRRIIQHFALFEEEENAMSEDFNDFLSNRDKLPREKELIGEKPEVYDKNILRSLQTSLQSYNFTLISKEKIKRKELHPNYDINRIIVTGIAGTISPLLFITIGLRPIDRLLQLLMLREEEGLSSSGRLLNDIVFLISPMGIDERRINEHYKALLSKPPEERMQIIKEYITTQKHHALLQEDLDNLEDAIERSLRYKQQQLRWFLKNKDTIIKDLTNKAYNQHGSLTETLNAWDRHYYSKEKLKP